jgi:uncharacterized protein (TIGR02217 family)
MAFHEIRFPDDIAFGARGGPEFNTSVVLTGGGFEQRNVNWQAARRRYDVGHGVKTQAQFQALLAFYLARAGRAHGFRFRDHADFLLPEQSIGEGDGASLEFQLFKRYSSGGIDHDRALRKPVAGTVAFWLDASPQAEGADFSVDAATGLVTFAVAPAAGIDVRAVCEFDVPVRFDTDLMAAENPVFEAMTWPGIELVELRQ